MNSLLIFAWVWMNSETFEGVTTVVKSSETVLADMFDIWKLVVRSIVLVVGRSSTNRSEDIQLFDFSFRCRRR